MIVLLEQIITSLEYFWISGISLKYSGLDIP